ncbi:hypothetical protein ACLUX9_03835 [Limosilactobacillus reuteri subsp. suis]|uniref:hypothetical protein n=1 Tax=Limosilactobacillus reuteri TaxID=1598 RepID=UPI00399456CD
MQASLDEQDYQVITNEVLRRIKECYNLVPKQDVQTDKWVGIKEFTSKLPVIKDKEWVRMFLLTLPDFKAWVINLNAGQGRPARVNLTKALPWIMSHQADIDWNQSLPR